MASREFHPRRYVVAPSETPYPPGLAHDVNPVAAVSRESCIIHTASDSCGSSSAEVALTPDKATYQQWLKEYAAYHTRQATKRLGAAFCRFEIVTEREALAPNLGTAPVLSRADWEDHQLNVNGCVVREETGDVLARQIAEHGSPA
jgi:hypothetical protein